LIYLDSSLIVSLYCLDANSATAATLLATVEDTLLISTLVEIETVNTFALREFRKEITRQQAEASLQNFTQAVRDGVFLLRALPELAFMRARQLSLQLTPRLGVRSEDVLTVAVALELGATSFFSFDPRKRKMAEAAGLKLNPWS
jgi:predicted nucleic acid-binding protein